MPSSVNPDVLFALVSGLERVFGHTLSPNFTKNEEDEERKLTIDIQTEHTQKFKVISLPAL